MTTNNIILLFCFLGLSSFFSAAETALFSLSDLKLRRLHEIRYGRLLKNLLDKPTRLISTITIGNLIVNVGFSSLATAIFVKTLGDEGLIFAVLTSGFCILLFGEIFPKTLAIYLAEKIAPYAALVLSFFSVILRPFTFVFDKIVALFLSPMTKRLKKPILSDEELKAALFLGKKDGQISASEESMVSHLLEFKDTWVSEIMTHRVDVKGIDTALSQQDVLEILKDQKQSKIPVYSGSLDNIVGILYAKDIFLSPATNYHILMRPPIFIPESKKIDEVLKIFLDKNERIAIILDEYGGTLGLVTLEDIEEEIFGEIYDEFETPTQLIEKIEDGAYRIYGRAAIKDVNMTLNSNLPGQQDTIAGFLIEKMGKIPHVQDKLIFNNWEFAIERASVKRIISIVAKKLNES